MSANNNKKQQQQQNHSESCEKDLFADMNKFHMDIKDEFTDPLDHMYGIEKKLFRNPFDDFNLLSEEEKNQEREEKQQKGNGTIISQVYCSSYNNINGQPHQECYQSQSIKQMNDGHDISEAREAYKNSDGVMKSAYQRGLDKKGARFIKEKNVKTGQHNQHKILKGLKETEIDGFNKEYDSYSKKCGFKNNYKALNSFGFGKQQQRQQLGDGRKVNKNRN